MHTYDEIVRNVELFEMSELANGSGKMNEFVAACAAVESTLITHSRDD